MPVARRYNGAGNHFPNHFSRMTSYNSASARSSSEPSRRRFNKPVRIALGLIGIFASLALIGALLVGFTLAMAYPNLPALDSLTDYRPKIPLRIFSADNVLIGEFGEERRNLVHIKDV